MPIQLISPRRDVGETSFPAMSVEQAQAPFNPLQRLAGHMEEVVEEQRKTKAVEILSRAMKEQKHAISGVTTDENGEEYVINEPAQYERHVSDSYQRIRDMVNTETKGDAQLQRYVREGMFRSEAALEDNFLARHGSLIVANEKAKVEGALDNFASVIPSLPPDKQQPLIKAMSELIRTSKAYNPEQKRELERKMLSKVDENIVEQLMVDRNYVGAIDKLDPKNTPNLINDKRFELHDKILRRVESAEKLSSAAKTEQRQVHLDDLAQKIFAGNMSDAEAMSLALAYSSAQKIDPRADIDQVITWLNQRRTSGVVGQSAKNDFLSGFYSAPGAITVQKIIRYREKAKSAGLDPQSFREVQAYLVQLEINLKNTGFRQEVTLDAKEVGDIKREQGGTFIDQFNTPKVLSEYQKNREGGMSREEARKQAQEKFKAKDVGSNVEKLREQLQKKGK